MRFDFVLLGTSLRLNAWRNAKLDAITAQLEEPLSKFVDLIVSHVLELSTFEVGKALPNHRKLAEQLIKPWDNLRSNTAISRAQVIMVLEAAYGATLLAGIDVFMASFWSRNAKYTE